jgi:WD40 repeat protein
VIKIWDVAPARTLITLEGPTFVQELDWSPDGQRIATIHGLRDIYIWDVHGLPQLNPLPTATYIPHNRTELGGFIPLTMTPDTTQETNDSH